LPTYATSLDELLSVFIGQVGVDGVFCDQPDVAVRVRDRLSRKP
jgi:glycerophosphoryl diester phosphodiesterase